MPVVMYFSSAVHTQGGAVQSMFRMARWLKGMGGEPIVVLPHEGEILDWYSEEGIKTLVIPFVEVHHRMPPLYLIRYLFSTVSIIANLVALVKREQIDIVHVNEILYWPGLVAGKVAGVKTICHVRVIIERPIWVRRLLVSLVRYFSDQVLCVSQSVRDKMFPLEANNVWVLYNQGPDLDLFDPSVRNGVPIRHEFEIDAETFVVGLVSKFSPNKGHLYLVEAARLIREYKDEITYVLVGGKVSGHETYYEEVCQKLEQYALQESFVLTGVRTDIPELIAACDVIVHIPIHEDPLPNVVFEALAMEKPVVAFSSGGIPEQFEDGRSGILLEKRDTQALAETIINLSENEDFRLAIGREARRFLTSHFSFEKFFSELGAIYADLSSPTVSPAE